MKTAEQRAERDRREVIDSFRAAARLKLYGVWAAAFGAVLVIGAIGAMLIGWLGVVDGIAWVAIAILVAIVPAAKFYDDSVRTTIGACGIERQLDLDEDLYAGTASFRARVRRTMLIGIAVAVLAGGAVAVYSVANADTREDDDTEQDDDDDDDDENDGDENDGDDGGGDDGDDGGGDDSNDD